MTINSGGDLDCGVVLPRISFFNLKQRSFARGLLLSLGAFSGACGWRDSHIESCTDLAGRWRWCRLPVGMVETARCLRREVSLYHAGVLILLYTELMVLAMVLVLWVFL